MSKSGYKTCSTVQNTEMNQPNEFRFVSMAVLKILYKLTYKGATLQSLKFQHDSFNICYACTLKGLCYMLV